MRKWRPDLFVTFDDQAAQQLIPRAKKRIIYAAPSISEDLATSLLLFSAVEPSASIKVIVDPDYDALLLGYGDLEGIRTMRESGIDVYTQTGLRLGLLVVDDRSWIFTPTPRIVESPPEEGSFNALMISPEMTKWILKAVSPREYIDDEVREELGLNFHPDEDPEFRRDADELLGEDLLESRDVLGGVEIDLTPQIGKEEMASEIVEQLTADHMERPPRVFDHEREVRMYQAYLQFAELKFVGARISARKVHLPECLMEIEGISEARIDIEASCRLFENANKTFPELRWFEERIRRIRKEYFVVLSDLGSVMLRRRKDDAEREIDNAISELERMKTALRERLGAELERSRHRILDALAPVLFKHPPAWLAGCANEAQIRLKIEPRISDVLPTLGELIEHMELTFDRKDVTWEMLNSKEFREAVVKGFPDENFTQAYFEQKVLAEQTKPRERAKPADLEWPDEIGGDEDL